MRNGSLDYPLISTSMAILAHTHLHLHMYTYTYIILILFFSVPY